MHRRLGGAFEGGYRSQSCSAGCWSIKAALLLKSYQGKGEEGGEDLRHYAGRSQQGLTANGGDAARGVPDSDE